MLHTVDEIRQHATDRDVRAYLQTVDDQPVRYETADGTTVNTTACRGLAARYVLIAAQPDGRTLTVGAVRFGLQHRNLSTLQYLRPPAQIEGPGAGHLLAVLVGMCLDDLTDQGAP